MTSHHPKRIKKIGVYSIIALAVLSAFFLAYSSIGLEGISSAAVSTIPQGFTFQATLGVTKLEINAEDSTLQFTPVSDGSITVNDIDIKVAPNSQIMLSGFEGKIIFDQNQLLLDGCAVSTALDGLLLSKDGKCLDLNARINILSLDFDNFRQKSLKFTSSGRIDITKKGSFTVDNEELEIYPFEGSLSIVDSSLMLDGYSSAISIAGIPKISVK